MSVVELRRNSSPHLGTIPLAQSSPVWRKASHPPLNSHVAYHRASRDPCAPPPGFTQDDTHMQQGLQHNHHSDKDEILPERPVSPSVFQRMLLHSEDLISLIKSIASEARQLIHSETCSLFLLDNENKQLVAKVFDRAGDLSEIRIPMGQGVVGKVAVTKTLMNIRDVNRCPFFYPHVDELTGFETRNILCFPIVDNAGTFVGVTELCNRIGKSGFTKRDEHKARSFAVYCASSVSHCLLYSKVQEAQRRTHMASELLVQGSRHLISEEDVQRLSAEPIKTWRLWHPHFNLFSFAPRSIGNHHDFISASQTMFDDLGFITRYRINRRKLASFVLRVANGYREVPYHNWSHAFAVAHFCWLSLRTHAARSGLDELERLALLVAGLCHDIDHRGTSNSFQLQSKTPLAQLYSSEGSVLERHHYAQAVQILKTTECDILEQLTRSQFQTVLCHMRDIILATDIAAHLSKVHRIKAMVQEGYNPHLPDHHYLLLCLMMTASDLSDQSKDFRNSKAIAENIYREFFSQGDLEKAMGTKPMEMMDRNRACVPKIQLDFMDSVALPVFDMLSHVVPDSRSTFEAISHNRRCWAALDEIIVDRGHAMVGLDYLKDEVLERDVLSKVAKSDRENNTKEINNRH